MHIEQSKIDSPAPLGCGHGYLSFFVPAIVVTSIPTDMTIFKQEVASLKNSVRIRMTAIGHIACQPGITDTLQVVKKDWPISIAPIHFLS